MRSFPREQFLIMTGLAEADAELAVPELARRLAVDQALIAAGAQLLSEEGLVTIREEPYRELVLKEAGRRAVAEGFPERRLVRALLEAGGPVAIRELPGLTSLEAREVGACLRFLQQKGWASKHGGELRPGDALAQGEPAPGADETLLEALAQRAGARAREQELGAAGIEVDRAIEYLKGRRDWLDVRAKRTRLAKLTAAGRALAAAGVAEAAEVGQMTPEMITSGAWRDVHFKAYDVRLGVAPLAPGKPHPLQRTIAETRRIFLELGFVEVASPMVESGFWNFDALFQPQDHPARELQDTFYLAEPAEIALPPDESLVARVRATHEDGGETGSLGWRMPWNPARARAAVLRTHTTAATARALAAAPGGPRKVFCVGQVFRREAIDYKHLPLFHQVDGIIIDEAATFASLLGTLTAFYGKMGFERIELRPGFFPYTEPSVEVFIWVEAKKDWFEMGGAGIFRPEVTRPLGCEVPVLAWGLGLERLAMLRYGVLEMRRLYLPDLQWLKEVPLCR
ncbi:MAG: phenylalanine--tRNA ligase subunit alpha [Candidatus Eisenbacteria sp.]|nr:phenylalanine--tRNA ligase subunit alpha [Candidatus Eisenbacteria bacterium]